MYDLYQEYIVEFVSIEYFVKQSLMQCTCIVVMKIKGRCVCVCVCDA